MHDKFVSLDQYLVKFHNFSATTLTSVILFEPFYTHSYLSKYKEFSFKHIMADVAKFDIGGQVYKVSRSLLQIHPGCMRTNTPQNNEWMQDPESAIYLN